MPELPEVAALAGALHHKLVGTVVAAVDVAAISVLKTYDPPVHTLHGLTIHNVTRRGKFICIDVDGIWLVFHLARAGWVRWSDNQPSKPLAPGKNPAAFRVRCVRPNTPDGPHRGFTLTEAGTKKRLAVYVTTDLATISGVAALGIDPLSDDFTTDTLATLLGGQHHQIKGVLRDQKIIAGIGNAYSDDILHAAKLSPYALADTLKPAQVTALHAAITGVLSAAVDRAANKPFTDLKDTKRDGLLIHGRTGQPCPVCDDTIREVSFADSALQYCATCQTGGKPLADRRMSRLLK